MRRQFVSLVAVLALAVVATSHAPAETIYLDDFSGSSATNLNGQAPDEAPGTETWTASTEWKADGSISTTDAYANAFLPFKPDPGKIYTLSLEVNPTSGGDNWFALGFTESNIVTTYFSDSDPAPWMLVCADRSGLNTFLGPGTAGPDTHTAPAGWISFDIVLDTQSEYWEAKWYCNGGSAIRTETYTTNPTINHVGFGRCDKPAVGSVDNFELTVVPEPGTLALTILGLLTLSMFTWQRRKKK